MLSKLKTWALAALGAIAGIFYLMAQFRGKQRDKAEAERDTAQRNTEAVERTQETTNAVAKAAQKARQENAQEDKKRNETPKAERRTGNFGSVGNRLRDKD